MRSVAQGSMFGAALRWLAALALVAVSSGAFAFGSLSRFVVIDTSSPLYSTTGTWTAETPPPPATSVNPTYFGVFFDWVNSTGGAANATALWEFGNIAPSPGLYSFDVFIPDDNLVNASAAEYHLQSASWTLFGGCGAYSTISSFSGVDQQIKEGTWANVGTATLSPGVCYRLMLTNANNGSTIVAANAARAERLFESAYTITDMPRLATAFAAATTNITSTSGPAPTIITTLTVTCPQIGMVMVTGSGESAAVTNVNGTNFNGLAYSISKNSTATDNSNVVQSSALATFNGDANRDFLQVQRVDSCAASESITYRLTGYRSQAATGPGSFIWNGRLTAQYFATGF